MDHALTDRDVAAMLKLRNKTSWKTVQKYAREGKILGKQIGNQWRFHPIAVENFLLLNPKRR